MNTSIQTEEVPAWPLALESSANGRLLAIVWSKKGTDDIHESNTAFHNDEWILYKIPLEPYLVAWLQVLCNVRQAYLSTPFWKRQTLDVSHALRNEGYAVTLQQTFDDSRPARTRSDIPQSKPASNDLLAQHQYIVHTFVDKTFLQYTHSLISFISNDAAKCTSGLSWYSRLYLCNPLTVPQPVEAVIPTVQLERQETLVSIELEPPSSATAVAADIDGSLDTFSLL